MAKDELQKEAYEWTEKNISVGISIYNPSIEMYCGKAYKDGAEPREKRIEELEDKLVNADYQLEGRDNEIRELKAQIEKMKCCYNCKHSRTEYEHCKTNKHEKWEIKENE